MVSFFSIQSNQGFGGGYMRFGVGGRRNSLGMASSVVDLGGGAVRGVGFHFTIFLCSIILHINGIGG